MDTIERYWDQSAADYDSMPDHGLLDPDTRTAWKDLLRTWLPTRPGVVADLACGTGTMSALAAEQGHEVIGIDISREMVARARAKLAPFGAACRVERGDVADPDLGATTVDIVLARHILWTLPDPVEAVRRWVRLVRPGGRLLLIEGTWGGNEPGEETDADRMPWQSGVASSDLREALTGYVDATHVVPLWDPLFWGKEIEQERYLLVADVGGAG